MTHAFCRVMTLVGILLLAALRPTLVGTVIVALCGGCGADASIKITPPPRGAVPLILGVNASADPLARQLGLRWIREEIQWAQLEPRPGVYRWASFDSLLVTAARNGLHVLPLVLETPSWAAPTKLTLPNDPQQFAAFVGQAAARYGPGGVFWRTHPDLDGRLAPQWFELWNEPYLRDFSVGGVDPGRYAQMVVAATAAGRAANPRTRWLMAVDYRYGNDQDWIAALYAAEPQLNQSFDGVAVHPYTDYGPTTAPPAAPLQDRFDRIGAIWTELAAHGAGNRPIWITELGWSTCNLRPDCVSPRDQAQNLADTFAQLQTTYRNVVRALFIYDLRDSANASPTDQEAHFGILEANGKPKPAGDVIRVEERFMRR